MPLVIAERCTSDPIPKHRKKDVKKMRISTITCAGLSVLLFIAGGALADLAPIGDPLEGGSWGQRFNESNVGDFDFMAVRMSSDHKFEQPTFRNFSSGVWSVAENSSMTLANAAGPTVTSLNFDLWFEPAKSEPLAFDFVSFHGDVLKDAAEAADRHA
jgi:hypothetical protein